MARANGRNLVFPLLIDYGLIEVKRLLKRRSPYVSLADMDTLEELKAASRVIYRRQSA
jgi:hypothetical protein